MSGQNGQPGGLPRAGMLVRDTSLRVVGMIGGGELSVVMLCDDEALLRQVAVKFLRPDRADPERIAAFVELFRSTARVSSPTVVAIFDVGMHDGLPFVEMEHVPGVSLAEHRRTHGGRLRLRAALTLVDGILSGLEALHESGIVHGTLTSTNTLVAPDGRVVLTDAGMDRVAAASWLPSAPTAARYRVSLPRGVDEGSFEAGTMRDVAAAAAIAYELVTGSEPSRTEAGRFRPASALVSLPASLDDALTSALSDADSPLRRPRLLRLALEAVRNRLGDETRSQAVLVVDADDRSAADTNRTLARVRRTLDVAHATSARMALLAARTSPADLIILNPDLPDMSGFELVSSLRALPGVSETPLLVRTHRGSAPDFRILVDLGATMILPASNDVGLNAAVLEAQLDACLSARIRRA